MNARSMTVTLFSEVEHWGKKTNEITIRRANLADEEASMEQALTLGKENNSLTVELCLLSLVTGIPYPQLRMLDGEDLQILRAAHASLSPALEARKKKEAEAAKKATTPEAVSTASA